LLIRLDATSEQALRCSICETWKSLIFCKQVPTQLGTLAVTLTQSSTAVTVNHLLAIYKYQAIIGDAQGYVQIEGNLAKICLHDVENKHTKEISINKTATRMLSSFMITENSEFTSALVPLN